MTRSTRPPQEPDRVVTAVADRRSTILDVIRGARREICLSVFRCNDEEIFAELARASSRGVAVEVLTSFRAKGGRKRLETLREALVHAGATVYTYSDPVVKYHAKYLVVDDGPAVVASLNFTRKCFNRTWDALLVTYDQEVVTGLRQLMLADRERRPLPDGLSPRLIIGPERARDQFTTLIRGAQSSIRLIDRKVSDPDLVALLNERRASGLAVEVVGSKRMGELKSHGKIMLIDNRLATIGSLALAALSLDFRREVAIVVEDPSAVADLAQLFQAAAADPASNSLIADSSGVVPC
jgi:phosphatidylserine/phosphatidylglycerophosphate/cardiolipin synthase-like enzyme